MKDLFQKIVDWVKYSPPSVPKNLLLVWGPPLLLMGVLRLILWASGDMRDVGEVKWTSWVVGIYFVGFILVMAYQLYIKNEKTKEVKKHLELDMRAKSFSPDIIKHKLKKVSNLDVTVWLDHVTAGKFPYHMILAALTFYIIFVQWSEKTGSLALDIIEALMGVSIVAAGALVMWKLFLSSTPAIDNVIEDVEQAVAKAKEKIEDILDDIKD